MSDGSSFPGPGDREIGPFSSRRRTRGLLLLLFAVGLILRLIGLQWDQGHHLHPDERFISMVEEKLSVPDRLVEFIRTAHFDDVGVCFDTGHAHIMSDVPSAFETVKKYVHSTHIHDNTKDRDSHLWPGTGSIDWKQTLELLSGAPQKPPLLLEIEEDAKINPIEKMGEVFRKAEAQLV